MRQGKSLRLPRRIVPIVCVLALTAAIVHARQAEITLSASTAYDDILKNGTTDFMGDVGNAGTATDSLDWTVDNDGQTGLTLSGAGTDLMPGAGELITGSYGNSVYGTYNIHAHAVGTSHTGGGPATHSPISSIPVAINVGEAIAADSGDDLHTFGDPLYSTVAAGGSYAGLASIVVGAVGSGSYLGTEAVLRAGTNTSGSGETVSMAWRNRANVEQYLRYYPHSGVPPLAPDAYNNVSDVVDLQGVGGEYVLEMTYDETEIIYDFPHQTEQSHALVEDWYGKGRIYLAWLNPNGYYDTGEDQWEYATYGNSYMGTKAVENFQGSFDDFLLTYPDFNTGEYMGSYGVDINDDLVWAVLDHTSSLGSIPEPGSLALLALGAGALRRRRRRKPKVNRDKLGWLYSSCPFLRDLPGSAHWQRPQAVAEGAFEFADEGIAAEGAAGTCPAARAGHLVGIFQANRDSHVPWISETMTVPV